MKNQQFDKFINQKVSGAKKKEQIKQEKRTVKKEREQKIIERKRELRAAKKLQQNNAENNAQAYKKEKNTTQKTTTKPNQKTTVKNTPAEKIQIEKKASQNTNYIDKKEAYEKQRQIKKTSHSTPSNQENTATTIQTSNKKTPHKPNANPHKFEKRKNDPGLPYAKKIVKNTENPNTTPNEKKPAIIRKATQTSAGTMADEIMPLNKYIAHGGICSRRDAGELVKTGKVKVNGEIITEPGYKVQPTDLVQLNGKKIIKQQNLVYILLNKPKDFITTSDDPQGRKTVLDIVKNATTERIYPVGRLDRNTSGVLLLTNDGELAQQLTHPSFQVKKIYEVRLDKPLTKGDLDKLAEGINLEDGEIKADSVAYADNKDKTIIGIEIHSGKNRIVRRMFEALGYDVRALDRVMFATLTKKNVERGKWRFLSEKEVRTLKFFNNPKK